MGRRETSSDMYGAGGPQQPYGTDLNGQPSLCPPRPSGRGSDSAVNGWRSAESSEDASAITAAALSIVADAKSLDQAMEALRDAFAMKHLSYVLARYGNEPHKDPYVLSTYPALWLTRYLFKRYWRIDPVVRAGFRGSAPFDWREIDRSEPKVAAFFADAARYRVGTNGFLIPLTNVHDQRGIVSVTSDLEGAAWEAYKRAVVKDFMEVAHAMHRRALREMFGDAEPPPRLSPREKEALRWVAEGKEVPDIAIITGLSEHTVRTYLKSARMKLDCGTKAQAAVKADRLALLTSDDP